MEHFLKTNQKRREVFPFFDEYCQKLFRIANDTSQIANISFGDFFIKLLFVNCVEVGGVVRLVAQLDDAVVAGHVLSWFDGYFSILLEFVNAY